MPTKQVNLIDALISEGELNKAHDRFREFLSRCEDESDTLTQNMGRLSELEQSKLRGLLAESSIEQNKILWDFVAQLRRFRREVLSEYFNIGDRESYLKSIGDRDALIREIINLRLGTRNYFIEDLMAEGNSSVIFRLKNPILNRHAVASVLKTPKLTEQAAHDISSLVSLRHRNIIKVQDYDLSSFPYFVISEFVYGGTVRDIIETTGPRPATQAVDWLHQLADALDYLRHRRIFHTNVRPSKIFIDDEWQVMLSPMDMRIISGGELSYDRYLDVCQYGSPEMLLQFGKLRDTELADQERLKALCLSDQYSLGLVGYKILTGQDLFEGSSAHEILFSRQRFANDKAWRKEKLSCLRHLCFRLPDGKKASLLGVLERALQEDPCERYPDIHDFIKALRPFQHGHPHETHLLRSSYRRCLAANRELIRDFYKALFVAAPVQDHFGPLGEKRQLSMLQMALDVLLDLDQRREQLVGIVRSQAHQKYGAVDFEVFTEVLLQTIERNDPMFDEATRQEWQGVKERTMEIVRETLAART